MKAAAFFQKIEAHPLRSRLKYWIGLISAFRQHGLGPDRYTAGIWRCLGWAKRRLEASLSLLRAIQ
tara:strand:- start:155 stop:352 length:198 start_codon:yes stop_codon:yes gene_type:complete